MSYMVYIYEIRKYVLVFIAFKNYSVKTHYVKLPLCTGIISTIQTMHTNLALKHPGKHLVGPHRGSKQMGTL